MSDMENKNEEIKINGAVENVVFHNTANSFSVIEVNSGGEIITAVGVLSDIAPGEEVVLYGTWISHSVFGRQFKIIRCERCMPDTTAKLFRYLSSGAVKGIGPKTAMKIIQCFGENSFDILENQPEKLAAVNGISKQKAIDIGNEFKSQYAMRKVILELEKYGITAFECAAIYKYFGLGALQIIHENPYILCGTINGFNFERAEKLAHDMQLTPKDECRNRAGILYIISHNLRNGHTCIPRKKLSEPSGSLLNISPEETDATIDDLIKSHMLFSAVINGEDCLFLPQIFRCETGIAERVKNILKFPPSKIEAIDSDIDRIEKKNGIKYAEMQRTAIRLAGEKGILVLTGGPGTGKTTTLRGIIELFERKHMNILLCAPTGRAAKRLSEVTGCEAKTIHRLLEVEWDDDDKPVFRRNAANPLCAGALIVDEMSMVDVELFDSLLNAVPMGCRIILVGDSDQLPSVGPGNVLTDLISSNIIPVVCLTEIFRQAQQSLIVMNSHRIINGEPPVLNSADNDFFFLRRDSSFTAAKAVCDLISKRLPDAYGFSITDDIQILCPSRKGDCGSVNLNKRLQQTINPPDPTKGEISTSGGRVFREGDRVMQIRNNYNIHWTRGAEEGDGIFNGDIGILGKINYGAGIMTIEFDDRKAEYPTDNLSELELAYAVTVHKSQGSEYNAVIVPVVDCPPMLLYRNLLYTAVTRAKKMLVIVGNESRVLKMTENNRVNRRYSGLKTFLLS